MLEKLFTPRYLALTFIVLAAVILFARLSDAPPKPMSYYEYCAHILSNKDYPIEPWQLDECKNR